MKFIKLIILLIFTTTSFSQNTISMDGIEVPTTIKIKKDNLKAKLVLNGCGIRDKFWISLYVQALYLTDKNSDAVAILESKEPMMLRLTVTSSLVTKQKLVDALQEGMKKSQKGKIDALQEKMDKFMSFFTMKIKELDIIEFIYNPNIDSLMVYVNDENIGNIGGFEFKKAFFGIWLEEKAVDKTLKRRLLGL